MGDVWFKMSRGIEEVKSNLDSRKFQSGKITGFLNRETVI